MDTTEITDLGRAEKILGRAADTFNTLENECELDILAVAQIAEIKRFMGLTQQVCDTAHRRVLEDEKVPNEDKLFSIFPMLNSTSSA